MLLAKKLREYGMSQSKISGLLGVTQPAVKQYLDEDESKGIEKLNEMGISSEEVASLLNTLVDLLTNNDVKGAMYYLTDFGLKELSELKLCKYHKEKDKYIPQDCEICKNLYRTKEEDQMEIALSMVQNTLVTPLIPEVLSNLAYARQNAKSENDIIAVAGRITKVMGLPTPASRPMWGASKHLSKILLNVMIRNSEIRSVMNIKFDDKVDKAIKKMGLKVAYIGPKDSIVSDDEIVNDILRVYSPELDCVVHLGGKGIEANTYVFGKDPIEVVKKVIEIGRAYREITEN
ncbi:transcriptional regulator [Stygiolobus caldivivus]|uniref:Transcriptional regulator n=2 Tax=Stygiolobus caldivivus TaxID=2824673 RepID=A0A8D5ZJW1_9CREN|nr:transcriptional regulator [Stygiolobus caldivivus]